MIPTGAKPAGVIIGNLHVAILGEVKTNAQMG
jgi:hypothetical protein